MPLEITLKINKARRIMAQGVKDFLISVFAGGKLSVIKDICDLVEEKDKLNAPKHAIPLYENPPAYFENFTQGGGTIKGSISEGLPSAPMFSLYDHCESCLEEKIPIPLLESSWKERFVIILHINPLAAEPLFKGLVP